jgi:hypothetical protein
LNSHVFKTQIGQKKYRSEIEDHGQVRAGGPKSIRLWNF